MRHFLSSVIDYQNFWFKYSRVVLYKENIYTAEKNRKKVYNYLQSIMKQLENYQNWLERSPATTKIQTEIRC